MVLQRILTGRGTEYCGNAEHPEYQLHLAVENIDHSRTTAKSPQTNGIVERYHKTMLNECLVPRCAGNGFTLKRSGSFVHILQMCS